MTRTRSIQLTLSLIVGNKVSDNAGCYQPVSGNEDAPGMPLGWRLGDVQRFIEEQLAAGTRGETNIRHMTGSDPDPARETTDAARKLPQRSRRRSRRSRRANNRPQAPFAHKLVLNQ